MLRDQCMEVVHNVCQELETRLALAAQQWLLPVDPASMLAFVQANYLDPSLVDAAQEDDVVTNMDTKAAWRLPVPHIRWRVVAAAGTGAADEEGAGHLTLRVPSAEAADVQDAWAGAMVATVDMCNQLLTGAVNVFLQRALWRALPAVKGLLEPGYTKALAVLTGARKTPDPSSMDHMWAWAQVPVHGPMDGARAMAVVRFLLLTLQDVHAQSQAQVVAQDLGVLSAARYSAIMADTYTDHPGYCLLDVFPRTCPTLARVLGDVLDMSCEGVRRLLGDKRLAPRVGVFVDGEDGIDVDPDARDRVRLSHIVENVLYETEGRPGAGTELGVGLCSALRAQAGCPGQPWLVARTLLRRALCMAYASDAAGVPIQALGALLRDICRELDVSLDDTGVTLDTIMEQAFSIVACRGTPLAGRHQWGPLGCWTDTHVTLGPVMHGTVPVPTRPCPPLPKGPRAQYSAPGWQWWTPDGAGSSQQGTAAGRRALYRLQAFPCRANVLRTLMTIPDTMPVGSMEGVQGRRCLFTVRDLVQGLALDAVSLLLLPAMVVVWQGARAFRDHVWNNGAAPRGVPARVCASCEDGYGHPFLCPDHLLCVPCVRRTMQSRVVDFLTKQTPNLRRVAMCQWPGCPGVPHGSLGPLLHLLPEELAYVAWAAHIEEEAAAMWGSGSISAGAGSATTAAEAASFPCPHCDSWQTPQAMGGNVVQCLVCGGQHCVGCRGPVHSGNVCLGPLPSGGSPADLLAAAKIQFCPGCRVPEVKHKHCNHVTCTCGVHWCWACGVLLSPETITAHYRHVSPQCLAYSPATEMERMKRVLLDRRDVPAQVRDRALDLLATTFQQTEGDI
jgi:hypothetical protein